MKSAKYRRTAGQEEHSTESSLSGFFHGLQDHDGGAVCYLLRRPVPTLVALRSLLRLPVLEAITKRDTVEAAAVDRALAQRHTNRRFLPHASVLVLPQEAGEYSIGPSRQTLRRMVRKAERAGIVCSRVEDPHERHRLFRIFDEWERATTAPGNGDARTSNEDLLDYHLWLVARSRDGRPLTLSVTPVEGSWALLRYFRTVGIGPEQSLGRYALLQFLVEQLVEDRVRYLFDETSPARLSNGLRHYQRMVGFRLFRIRVRTMRQR